MKDWLIASKDYPALSCGSCADLMEKEGERPICADGVCPKAYPDGPAGVAASLWSDLKTVKGILDGRSVLRAYGLAPDRTTISLLRYLEAHAVEILETKLIKMETV